MSSSEQLYCPVIRFRPAETLALSKSPQGNPQNIKPILELIPERLEKSRKAGHSIDSFLEQTAGSIFAYWGEDFYLDLHHIRKLISSNNGSCASFANRAKVLGLTYSPVITIGTGHAIGDQLSEVRNLNAQTIAVRAELQTIDSATFINDIDQIASELGVSIDEIDLICDAKYIPQKIKNPAEMYLKIPHLSLWKNVILLGGSFPQDLSSFKVGDWSIPRHEWALWRSLLKNKSGRIPLYGDYTSQHAIYTEKSNKFRPSPSIRYTSGNEFLVFRGSLKYGSEQYPAHASLLCGQKHFSGVGFSFGDTFIYEKSLELAKADMKPGKHGDWLAACINHHLALVVVQLEEVFARIRSGESLDAMLLDIA